jgi:hypothetical protein
LKLRIAITHSEEASIGPTRAAPSRTIRRTTSCGAADAFALRLAHEAFEALGFCLEHAAAERRQPVMLPAWIVAG